MNRLDVLLAQTDAPAAPEALPGDGGQARPGDGDAVAQARRILDHLLVEPLPEGAEQRDRDGAPDDPEDRERRPELLTAHVAQQLPHSVFDVLH